MITAVGESHVRGDTCMCSMHTQLNNPALFWLSEENEGQVARFIENAETQLRH